MAHDGSRNADALLADIPRAGLPATGSLTVLTIADAWAAMGVAADPMAGIGSSIGANAAKAALEEATALAKANAEAVADRVRVLLPRYEVRAEHAVGSPGWEIIRRADESRPDLVMLGATGTSKLERMFFGTTAQQVAHHVRASVRIARPRASASGGVHVLLGCDGSAASLAAARVVAKRTWPAGSDVAIVVADESWLFGALEGPDAAATAGNRDIAHAADEAEVILKEGGLATRRVLREGDPKHALVDEARKLAAEVVFVGARGWRGVQRLLLGSVALAVAARAPCSVEIVRSAQAQ
jgi:nucleotide-binding universal stress UspA family protein